MWGWLDGIVSGLDSIWESIKTIPTKLGSISTDIVNNIINTSNSIITNVSNGFSAIGNSIVNAASNIISNVSDGFRTIGDYLYNVFTAIVDLPELIFNGIKRIFIPDSDYINTAYSDFVRDLKLKFNLNTTVFESLFDSESAVEDIKTNYTILGVGTFELKMFDASYFRDAVAYFRPFIRGFLVLLMFLYHIKQLIGFFGYNSGVVDGRTEHIKESK